MFLCLISGILGSNHQIPHAVLFQHGPSCLLHGLGLSTLGLFLKIDDFIKV